MQNGLGLYALDKYAALLDDSVLFKYVSFFVSQFTFFTICTVHEKSMAMTMSHKFLFNKSIMYWLKREKKVGLVLFL